MKIKLMSYRVDGDGLDSMVGGCCMGMVQEHVSLKFHPITSLSSSQKAFVGISKVAFWNRWSCGHCRRLFPPEGSLQVRIFQSTAASIEAFYYRAMLHFLKEIPKTIPQKCQFPSASVFGRSGKVHIYIYIHMYVYTCIYIYISYISYISYINII